MKTPNGENPLMHGATPVLGCDVWEHSYYIDYRNARPKYLEAFVDNLINWDHVAELYEKRPSENRQAPAPQEIKPGGMTAGFFLAGTAIARPLSVTQCSQSFDFPVIDRM
jgi:hypothetical protein